MLEWSEYAGATVARYRFQGGPFVAVAHDPTGWTVRFVIGPVGTYRASSRSKAMAFVERFVSARTGRAEAFGRKVAAPGLSIGAGQPYQCITPPEVQAAYDAFTASYVPPKRRPRRPRR